MMKTLDNNYSTTKLCYKLLADKYLDENRKIKEEYKFKLNFQEFGIVDNKITKKEEEKFDTYLFLAEGENRKGEGGLRTKGYFKFSYSYDKDLGFGIEDLDIPVKISPTLNLKPQNYPLITIVTVIYNGEKYLEQTIQSVINQNYPNIEYIIIDGGSTDGTLDIIKKYEDYIDYWISEKDRGIYDAMNKGIELANGKYVLFLNADDYLYSSDSINCIMNHVENEDIVYGNINYLYENGNLKLWKGNLSKDGTKIPHPAFFVKGSILKKYKFDTSYRIAADYDLMIKLFQDKSLSKKYCDCIVTNFRVGGASSNFWATFKETIHIHYKYFGFINAIYESLKRLYGKFKQIKIKN